MLEVEIKAALGDVTAEALQQRAEKKGFEKAAALREIDVYFNGNDRNFMKTDEALRLRSCQNLDSGNAQTLITYKGPKIDAVSSTRKEYETAVGDLSVMRELLAALGYQEAFTVDKERREWKLAGGDPCSECGAKGAKGAETEITLCIDTVAGLGRFMELETLVDSDIEAEKEAAVQRLLTLLDQFGVPRENLTRKSYLEMLFMAKK